MRGLDWLVVAAYAVGMVAIGLWLTRRASRSTEEFLVAGRKMPWWLIGFSDVANADGADALWVMTIFTGAFMGLFRAYWVSYTLLLPLAVVWARYWRRLRLISPGQLYEVRYAGTAAARFRGFSAIYSALVSSSILIAYVLKAFSQALAPFFGWPVDVVLVVFCVATLAYTVLSGILGDAYTDVPQFITILIGRVLLAWIVVSAAGGLSHVLDVVTEVRGREFLRPYPPSHADVYGKFSIEALSLLALIASGLLNGVNVSSTAVQRSLAARSEADAAGGQILNALLTLVFRMIPLVLIGLAAVALYPTDFAGEEIWADMVRHRAGAGVVGLLVVGVVAGYMSTLDSFLNQEAAGLFNDFYRRHLRPNCSEREGILFCRLAVVGVTAAAYLWARFLMGKIDAAWLNFINSVLWLFLFPLGLLRWTWWRLNVWGEIVGFVLAFPLAYLVWFTWDMKDAPYWQSFGILVGLGWTAVVLVTLATKPEAPETLARFYRIVRPPGFWGPVAATIEPGRRAELSREIRRDLVAAAVGALFCASMVVAFSACFSRRWGLVGVLGATTVVSGVLYARLSMAATRLRKALSDE